MRTRHHSECPSCTCGMTEVQWSDRSGLVDLTDSVDIAQVTMHCVLDHVYDHPGDGVPYGLPMPLAEQLAAAIDAFLTPIRPDWREKTVFDLTEVERIGLLNALAEAARAAVQAGGR